MTKMVGVVKEIYRYPVKGMGGEMLQKGGLGWHGIEGDRNFAFIQDDASSGRPWLTGRSKADLIRYQARYAEEWSRSAPVEVDGPDGQQYALDDEVLRAEIGGLFDIEAQLLKLTIGCFDAMQVSLISTSTLAALSAEVGIDLDVRRFRPNILFEPVDGAAFVEDGWLGRDLMFGNPDNNPADGPARLRVHRQNVRCVMITLDPETAVASPQVLKTVAQQHNAKTGVYAATEQPGEIKVGDQIWLGET